MSTLRALVTGSSRGLGRAIALRLAREQARVVVAARNSSELDRVVAEIEAAGGSGMAAQLDVAEHGSVEAGVWRALQFLDGGLDLLVHAASACAPGGLAELEIADWKRALEVQVDGPMYVTRECLDALREGERPLVVLLARSEALEATAGGAASAAAHAARGLAASWSKELGPAVRVAVIVRDPARSDEDIADAIARAWREAPE